MDGRWLEVNECWEMGEHKRTQNKTPDSLVVKRQPKRSAVGENLDATNSERIDIHRRAELVVMSLHQLWCLPSEGSTYTVRLVSERTTI